MTLLFLITTSILKAQVAETLNPVVVTASRIQLNAAAEARQWTVIGGDEIAGLPGTSVPDLLRYASGVDLRSRGAGGVQADFGLRGSSFEQVLVLIDGMRINDPQTGHFNGDLPVLPEEIDRIEILHGPASALYGADGFGGVINILTRQSAKPGGQVSLSGGSFGTASVEASQAFHLGQLNGRFSAARQTSNGYREDTDYDIRFLTHRGNLLWGSKTLDWTVGWQDKDFGAEGFYADYPSREATKTFLSGVRFGWQVSPRFSLHAQSQIRRHDDRFVLDSAMPSWYVNDHRSWTSGLEVNGTWAFSQDRQIVFGLEGLREDLASSNLGNRLNQSAAVFAEGIWRVEPWTFHAGVRLDRQMEWGSVVSPSLFIVRNLSQSLRWRVGAARAFRAPTFTERFYHSPTDLGNPSLHPETGWCLESGISHQRPSGQSEATVFYRLETNRINWVRWNANDPWQAVNIGRVEVWGIGLQDDRIIGPMILKLGYTGLIRNSDVEQWFSKYGVLTLRHQFTFGLNCRWPSPLEESVHGSIRKREGEKVVALLETRLACTLGPLKFGVELTNLLDVRYEDIPGVPMPGRAVSAFAAWRLGGGE